MNLAQSIAVLTLLALPLVTSAQKRDKTEGNDKSNRTTQLIRESWQHVAFHAITELQDQEIPQTLENQTFGFGLTYMKHDRSGLFDGGLDLGVQPFGTRTLSETLWSEIEEDSVQADVTLRSNMVRAHYVLRTTLFKNRGFQPYAELFGGIRGAMVTSAFALDDGNKLPGQLSHTSLNFSFGYAVGVRLRLTKRAFLNARVCQFSHLQGGDEVDVINLDEVTIDSQGMLDGGDATKQALLPYSARIGLAFDF